MEQPDDIAGRIVLVVDAALPVTAREACEQAGALLAQRAGVPVTLATVPIEILDRVQPVVRAGPLRLRELRPFDTDPGAMGSAPFVWRDGRPDWGTMWTTFCELALHGGPPQRGPEQALRAPDGARPAESAPAMRAELERGILETTGLVAEPAEPGWLAVRCESGRMAAWLCAAIILENVEAAVAGDRLLLPAGPDFRLEDQVKSVITVLAKTHHYWREHRETGGRGTR